MKSKALMILEPCKPLTYQVWYVFKKRKPKHTKCTQKLSLWNLNPDFFTLQPALAANQCCAGWDPVSWHMLPGAVIQTLFTVPFFFFLKAGHMEPISLFSVVLSHRKASGTGRVCVWSCMVTVSPGSPLLVDMWSRAAYCKPDVGTHLQFS